MLKNLYTVSWLWLLVETTAKLTKDKAIPVLENLSKFPAIKWGIAVFAVMAMATAAIAKWTGNLDKIITFYEKYLSRKKPEITEAQRQKARADLIEILLRQVIKRLEDSLHHKIRIDLKREEQRQWVGKGNLVPVQDEEIEQTPDNFIKRIFNPFTETTPPEADITNKSTQELFKQEDIQGRLLILGEPGSGKTNELLVLARDLLYQAQQSPEKPIPVIFELSEWKLWNSEEDFSDWLAQQLFEKYSIPLVVSKHWMRTKQLLPLLDGLDELRRVYGDDEVTSKKLDERRIAKQIQCVRKINSFLDRLTLPLVVCCRRKEYEALKAQGEYLNRLNGAIYLQSLEDEQIQEYLQELNRNSLWKSLQNQPELLKLAHSPLFLLILVVAYKGQNINSTEELLDEYIHKQLNDLNNQGAYPPGKAPSPKETHHYLSWLAGKLEFEETTEFLIEQLQPSWIDTPQDRKNYRWIIGLISGLIFGLIFGVTIELIEGQSRGLIFGPIFGLIGGWSVGLSDINKSERLNYSWKIFCRAGLIYGLGLGLSEGLSGGSIKGLIGGLIGGLSGGLSRGWSVGLSDINKSAKLSFSWDSFCRAGLIFGLIGGVITGLITGPEEGLNAGLIFGLIGGLSEGLIGGLSEGLSDINKLEKLSFSWESFCRAGLFYGLSGGLIFGLSGGMIYGLSEGLSEGRMVRLIGGLSKGLIFGLVGGPIFGLIGGMIRGIEISEIDVRDKINPNQGIKDSIRNGLSIGLSVGLSIGLSGGMIIGLSGGLDGGLSGGPIIGLIGGMIVGLIAGLDAVFKHISLRIVLYESGISPWNYKKFLDHAENHRFIQRIGGRYRFVHDLLRKRFAATLKQP